MDIFLANLSWRWQGLTKILISVLFESLYTRPNEKISVFQGMGLKILGWVGTHVFFFFFFFFFFTFKMHKIIFFLQKT